jgi:Icc-related predicted phosphoesterase
MRVVLLSDTHGAHRQVRVPDGDVLVAAGDATRQGNLAELADFDEWLGTLPHRQKIVIAGNRDFCFQRNLAEARRLLSHATYLQDESILVDGLRFYGTPWQPPFLNMAFNLERGEPLRAKWSLIPSDTDILITHTPPFGRGDTTRAGAQVGDRDLAETVSRLRPKVHVFGHIHEGYGKFSADGTIYINASVVDASFQVANAPWEIDIERPTPF